MAEALDPTALRQKITLKTSDRFIVMIHHTGQAASTTNKGQGEW